MGIHYSSLGITAALVEKRGSRTRLAEVFKIAPETENTSGAGGSLIDRLAAQLKRRHSKIPSVALALAGEFYQSQFHHSEFSDQRMLRQTLRFDVEEDFATDAETFALCYQRTGVPGPGSNLIIHTFEREKIQDLLVQFEQVHLDALVAEPDIDAWVHYLKDLSDLPADQPFLSVAWTAGIFYILALDRRRQPVLARSCVCSSREQLNDIMIIELRRCLALLDREHQPRQLLYHSGGFTKDQVARLQKELNLPCQGFKEPDAATALAGGAALGWLHGSNIADFRTDGMTPRTVQKAQHKALYSLSAAVTLLMLSSFIVMQLYARKNKNLFNQADLKLTQAWENTQPDDPPENRSRINSKLQNDYDALQNQLRRQTTTTLPNSVSNTLLIVLQTLNTLPETFNLQYESLRVNNQGIALTGIIPNLAAQEKLHLAFKDNPEWGDFTYESALKPEGRRDTLIVPLKSAQVDRTREGR